MSKNIRYEFGESKGENLEESEEYLEESKGKNLKESKENLEESKGKNLEESKENLKEFEEDLDFKENIIDTIDTIMRLHGSDEFIYVNNSEDESELKNSENETKYESIEDKASSIFLKFTDKLDDIEKYIYDMFKNNDYNKYNEISTSYQIHLMWILSFILNTDWFLANCEDTYNDIFYKNEKDDNNNYIEYITNLIGLKNVIIKSLFSNINSIAHISNKDFNDYYGLVNFVLRKINEEISEEKNELFKLIPFIVHEHLSNLYCYEYELAPINFTSSNSFSTEIKNITTIDNFKFIDIKCLEKINLILPINLEKLISLLTKYIKTEYYVIDHKSELKKLKNKAIMSRKIRINTKKQHDKNKTDIISRRRSIRRETKKQYDKNKREQQQTDKRKQLIDSLGYGGRKNKSRKNKK
jgi:hypothetical protein